MSLTQSPNLLTHCMRCLCVTTWPLDSTYQCISQPATASSDTASRVNNWYCRLEFLCPGKYLFSWKWQRASLNDICDWKIGLFVNLPLMCAHTSTCAHMSHMWGCAQERMWACTHMCGRVRAYMSACAGVCMHMCRCVRAYVSACARTSTGK